MSGRIEFLTECVKDINNQIDDLKEQMRTGTPSDKACDLALIKDLQMDRFSFINAIDAEVNNG